MRTRFRWTTLALTAFLAGASGCGPSSNQPAIDLTLQKWCGNAICYSGYREGQNPDAQAYPSQAEILEDLKILAKHWALIRTYGSDRHGEDVLEVIHREKLPIKVVLGAWLGIEPGSEDANARQIHNCIRLANAYKDVVAAVGVGNEILVSWSNHKIPLDRAIQYVRQVADSVSVPVTVMDDFTFWRDGGSPLAEVVDFVSMHTYPMWGGQDIDSAMAVTVRHFESVRKALPGKTIVITEAGWATYTEGPMHALRAGDEVKQKRYFEELTAWSRKNGVNVFFFEAFDEPWKGKGTEGHWGLFSVGRKAKLAMRDWYPELIPDGPTSPGYGP
jgi:exo-beta-1,3-glucanase (GH17 family)